MKVAFYMRVGNKEQLNFHNEEVNEINNADSSEKYAIYIRTNKTEKDTIYNMLKEELLQFAKNNKINIKTIYYDFNCSGKLDKRIALEIMVNDIKNKNINGIIVKSFEQLIRDDIKVTQKFLENLNQLGAKIIVESDVKLRDFNTINQIINGKLFPNEPTYKELQEFVSKKQNEEITRRKNKMKER